MCCLSYEQCGYEEKIKRVPKVGSLVSTPKGEGTVISANILKEEVSVKLKVDKDDDVDLEKFKAADVKVIKGVVEKNNNVENIEDLKNLED